MPSTKLIKHVDGPRTYTEEQKATAVGIYRTDGSKAAARQTGIPESTIKSWARRLNVHTEVVSRNQAAVEAARVKAELRREDVREKILTRIERVLERMVEPAKEIRRVAGVEVEVTLGEPTPTGMRELAVTLGILIDKLRLEGGEVTDRTARSSDVTVRQMSDERIDRGLAQVLRALPGGKPG